MNIKLLRMIKSLMDTGTIKLVLMISNYWPLTTLHESAPSLVAVINVAPKICDYTLEQIKRI